MTPQVARRNAEVAVAQLREALERLLEAYNLCNSSRGAWSCVDPHDLRCPKARARARRQWKGQWVCECGREHLDAALIAIREILTATEPK